MELLNSLLLVIHLLAIAGILVLLLRKNMKAPHRLNPGVLHSAATALVAGVAMVGIRYPLHDSDPAQYELFNNGKIGVKLAIVLIILVLGYANVKKSAITRNTWLALVLLTLTNFVIAVAI